MGLLGCGVWTAYLQSRGGFQVLTELPYSSMSGGRRIDEISGASVTVPAGNADDECCRILGAANPWEHEVSLHRDGQEAWCGPVQRVRWDAKGVTIQAKDLTQWFERRVLYSNTIQMTGTFLNEDLGVIYEHIAQNAMYRDTSPNITEIDQAGTGIVGTRDTGSSRFPRAADPMRELLRTGVDACAIGRKIYAGGGEIRFGPLETLITEHLLDPSAEIRGEEMANEVFLTGASSGNQSIFWVAGSEDEFGPHDFAPFVNSDALIAKYGLVQVSVSEPNIKDLETAQLSAEARLALLAAPPLYVTTDLAPEVPVDFDQLIPGRKWPISAEIGCKAIDETMRLKDVSWSVGVRPDSEEEVVSITLEPLGIESSEEFQI